jgi:hypothetical protein
MHGDIDESRAVFQPKRVVDLSRNPYLVLAKIGLGACAENSELERGQIDWTLPMGMSTCMQSGC